MSLIGSLEDLSLGDILQIISLSQKSGVLILSGDAGEGRIVFREGLVCAALVKGGARDLRGVLVDGGFVSSDDFRLASDEARERGVGVEETLVAQDLLPQERIDSLCRESVEQAVFAMFGWNRGDFSFDVRTEAESEDPEFALSVGINAQYLAMESARLGDEFEHLPAPHTNTGEDVDELSAHEMFGVAAEPDSGSELEPVAASTELESCDSDSGSEPVGDAAEIVALAAVETVAHEPELSVDGDSSLDTAAAPVVELLEEKTLATEAELQPPAEFPAADPVCEAADRVEPDELEELTEDALQGPPEGAPRIEGLEGDAAERRLEAESRSLSIPVIVIDPDLPTLEWVKAALADRISRVHIFQRSELGLSRIRQYLVRMESPMVLISPESAGDRLSGIADARDFVRRLKVQNPRTQVIWLCDETNPLRSSGPADGILSRPSEPNRRKIAAGTMQDVLAEKLVGDISRRLRDSGEAPTRATATGREEFSPDALQRLKEVTAVLNAGASRGEVLPLVIRFASESFSRVAMFMLRDDSIVGIAQSGLGRVGGPDDEGLQNIRIGREECAWFRRVFETGASVASGPEDDGDRAFSSLLGDQTAARAYVAPISSAGQIVALLYADNLPDQAPLGDTSALEVVLHHAGLALDRAVLERALAEIENETEDMTSSADTALDAAEGTRANGQSPPSASRNGDADR